MVGVSSSDHLKHIIVFQWNSSKTVRKYFLRVSRVKGKNKKQSDSLKKI